MENERPFRASVVKKENNGIRIVRSLVCRLEKHNDFLGMQVPNIIARELYLHYNISATHIVGYRTLSGALAEWTVWFYTLSWL
jgi:hypothetical protein